MINRNHQENNYRQIKGWRRLLACLCAMMLLVSSSGLSAFAESADDIYSDPVHVPKNREEVTVPPAEDPETMEPSGETEKPAEEEPSEPTEPAGEEPVEEESVEPTEEDPETTEPAGETAEPDEEESAEPTEEITPEPTPDQVYYPGVLNAETEGCSVQIGYTAEARIPEEAILTIKPVDGMELYAALKSAAKVVRNDENETWGQKVADDGYRFYAVTITDSEGNQIQPYTGVTLTCTNADSPENATYFLAGSNARMLEEQNGTFSVADYAMEPFGYATLEMVQNGIVTQEYNGRDYQVIASYGPEAGFPADTELKVREIKPGTAEYVLYSGMTDEALNEEWSEITLERYFDITFISKGKEIEPQAEIDVQIIFKDVIELTEEHDVQAVHIENNEATVISAETDSNENAVHDDEAIDTISFSSDSFSVYGVVQRKKITKKVLAADGLTYEINVTYGPEAEIPEDAQLKVEEIPEGSDLWEAYRKQTAAALGADDVRLPGLYDISILDAEGNKVEPKASVSVSIKLDNAEADEQLHVVHFTEEIPEELVAAAAEEKAAAEAQIIPETTEETVTPAEQTEIQPEIVPEIQPLAEEDMIASEKISVEVEGTTVTFETDGFSVYAFAYTVDFHYTDEDGNLLEWSYPGRGSYAVSDILAAIGGEGEITSVTLTLVEGELHEGALYLTQDEAGNWFLNSDIAFQDTYELKIEISTKTYVLLVTDAGVRVTFRINQHWTSGSTYEYHGHLEGTFVNSGYLESSKTENGNTYAITIKAGTDKNYGTKAIPQSANGQDGRFAFWLREDGTRPNKVTRSIVNGDTIDYYENAKDLTKDTAFVAYLAPADAKVVVINADYNNRLWYPANGRVGTSVAWDRGTDGGRYYYFSTDNVTLTATADNDCFFKGWYNGDELISANTTFNTSEATKDLVLTPVFEPIYNYTVMVNDNNRGSLSQIGNGSQSGTKITGKTIYEMSSGQPVNPGYTTMYQSTIANPNSGSDFVYWIRDDGTEPVTTGDGGKQLIGSHAGGTDRNLQDRDTTYIAFFAPAGEKVVRLNWAYPNGEAGTTSGGNLKSVKVSNENTIYYTYTGQGGTINATPQNGYHFAGWYHNWDPETETGELISTSQSFSINSMDITRNLNLTPVFRNSYLVWFDGSNGIYGGSDSNGLLYSRINGDGDIEGCKPYLVELPTNGATEISLYLFKSEEYTDPSRGGGVQGKDYNKYVIYKWYDVYQNKYYNPGDTVTINADTVLYAVWFPSSYDFGHDDGDLYPYVVDTNHFITTHVFDYNNIYNIENGSIVLDRDASYINRTGNYEYWSVKGENNDFVFFEADAGSGRTMAPSGRNTENWNGSQSGRTEGVWSKKPSNLFSTSSSNGKRYVGEGNYLYSYDSESGYYYYDSSKNAASYNASEDRFYVYNYKNNVKVSSKSSTSSDDFLPFNYGNREFNEMYGQVNYWFGMTSEIKFFLPNDTNFVDEDEQSGNRSIKGDEMVYEFSGDDDVWVLVDGSLLLDLGGVHGAVSGKINFSTGKVYYGTSEDKTFTLEAGEHTLTLYYLERGASQSNCSIRFNIAPKYTMQIIKKDANTNTGLGDAVFGIYEDEACTQPAQLTDYNGNEATTFTTGNDGIKHCKGLIAGHTYYIKELTAPDKYPDVSKETIKLIIKSDGRPRVETTAGIDAEVEYSANGTYMLYLTVFNTKQPLSVKLRKYVPASDGSNNKVRPIEGIRFKVYTEENYNNNGDPIDPDTTGIPESYFDPDTKEFITDSLGRFYEGIIQPGTYYLVETQVPYGIKMPTNPVIKLTIGYDSTNVKFYYSINDGTRIEKKPNNSGTTSFDVEIPNETDTASIKIEKIWTEDTEASAVLLKLGRIANDTDEGFIDVSTLGLNSENLYTYNGTTYIKINGPEWSELTVANLPMLQAVRTVEPAVEAVYKYYYYIEEYAYIVDDHVVEFASAPMLTATYSGTNSVEKLEHVTILAQKEPDKLTVTNSKTPGASITIKKNWSDNAASYDQDEITVKLFRYKKSTDEPDPTEAPTATPTPTPTPDPTAEPTTAPTPEGTLRISHVSSGVAGTTELPEGFEVTYSYTNENGSVTATGVQANTDYIVPVGNYTVTATVTDGAALQGYTYQTTNATAEASVSNGGTGTATFTSTYTRDTGTLVITHQGSGYNGTALPDNFAATYSYSGPASAEGVSAGSYTVPTGTYTVTANVTSNAPTGYSGPETTIPNSGSVTVTKDETATAAFTSTYTAQQTQYYSLTVQTTHPNDPDGLFRLTRYYPAGTVVTVSFNGGNEYGWNPYNANQHFVVNGVDRGSIGRGVSYPVTINSNTTVDITNTGNSDWGNTVGNGNMTLSPEGEDHGQSSHLIIKPVRFRADGGTISGGGGATEQTITINGESYIAEETTVTLERSKGWETTLTEQPVYDENGNVYYYIIREDPVPDGYEPSYSHNEPVSADSAATLSFTVTNTKPGEERVDSSVKVTKTDSTDGTVYPEGAVFTLYSDPDCENSLGITYGEADSSVFTISTADAKIAGLLPTENKTTNTYYMKETDAPTGYELSDTVYTITIRTDITREGNTITTSYTLKINGGESQDVPNTPLTGTGERYESITVVKTDNADTEIDGATFGLYTAGAEEPTISYPAGDQSQVVISTENDTLKSLMPAIDAEPVTLTLKEVTAPTGYLKSDTEYPVSIWKTEEIGWNEGHTLLITTTVYHITVTDAAVQDAQPGDSVTVPNTPVGSISVVKTVTDNGTESEVLNGRTIKIGLFRGDTEPADNAIPETEDIRELELTGITTTQTIFQDLPMGTYWVYELDADNQAVKNGGTLVIDGNTYTVTEAAEPTVTLAQANGEGTISITNNKEGTGSLVVRKVIDGDAADYTKKFNFTVTQTSEPKLNGDYGGMHFDNGIAHLVLGNDESATAENLPFGFTYTVTETEANQDDYTTTDSISTSITDNPTEANHLIRTGETETVVFANAKHSNTVFKVKKEWLDIIDASAMPTVYFTLKYYVPNLPYTEQYNNIPKQPEQAVAVEGCERIALSAANNWSWSINNLTPDIDGYPVKYFAEEYLLDPNKQSPNVYCTYTINGEEVEFRQALGLGNKMNEYNIQLMGYANSLGQETQDTYQRPFDVALGNVGTFIIRNRAPSQYMQMDIKKKFLEWRLDGNNVWSLWTTTHEEDVMKDLIIEVQVMRRYIDERYGDDYNYITGWINYGSTILFGYDKQGHPYLDYRDNLFEVYNAEGTWHYIIRNTSQNQGLPRRGFEYVNGVITPVRYQYILREVAVYDGDLNKKDEEWASWLPYAWDAIEDTAYKVRIDSIPMGTAQDTDRFLANIPATSLTVTKHWDPAASPGVDAVYVQVYKQTGSDTPTNFTAEIANYVKKDIVGTTGPDFFFGSYEGKLNTDYNALILSKDNDWSVTLHSLAINDKEKYTIKEIGYRDAAGNDHISDAAVNVFNPSYEKLDGSSWTAQGSGLVLTTNKANNQLRVTNTVQTVSRKAKKNWTDGQTPPTGTIVELTLKGTVPSAVDGEPAAEINYTKLGISKTAAELDGGTGAKDDTAAKPWEYEWTGLPKYDQDGNEITYTVTETAYKIDGTDQTKGQADETPTSGYDFSFTNTLPTTDIHATKAWIDDNDTEGLRPATITFTLKAELDGETLDASGMAAQGITTDNRSAEITVTGPADKTAAWPAADWTELPVYAKNGHRITYSVAELTVAYYTSGYDITGNTYAFTNTLNRMNIDIIKVKDGTSTKLDGAIFQLKREQPKPDTNPAETEYVNYGSQFTAEHGEATISNLPDGNYQLEEVQPPAGFIRLNSNLTFTVSGAKITQHSADGKTIIYKEDGTNPSFTIGNVAGNELPATGGSGTVIYTVTGLALILIAGVLLVSRRKKKEI